MSVLIKDMELPTSCGECPFVIENRHDRGDDSLCLASGKEAKYGCPLVPVPPHGRLIDADALEHDIRKDAEDAWNKEASPINWADAFYELADMVADAPTIIPASEECE